jgi:uncharacterized protein YdeI (YjbR/CyaY-like superfamily)
MAMTTQIEVYFASGCGRCARFATPDCSTRRWAEGLDALRRLCLGAGLTETVKWGHPCYVHAGRNIALIGAFRDDFRLTFFDAALVEDAAGVRERSGPNTAHPDTVRFTDPARVAVLGPVLQSYLTAAMARAEAAIRPPRAAPQAGPPPAELAEALAADPALAAAFAALTPGRQRSYAIALGGTKAAATRRARIARLRDRILAGKGATER